MGRTLALSLLVLLSARSAVEGVVPVVDAGNIVQSTISAIADVEAALNSATEVINSYTKIANQYTQIANQHTQIANQVQQIAHQVQNLDTFAGSSITQLLGVSTQIATTLGQAQGVWFHLTQATAQFDALYPAVTTVMKADALLTMRQQWVQHRRSAAATGVKVQAISHHLQTMATHLSQLLSHASGAKGNLAIQQVRAQQEGLTQALLLQIQHILAGNGRLDAQRGAEEATLQDATLQEIGTAFAPLPAYSGGQGALIHYQWK